MTWRMGPAAQPCGNCKKPIAKGEPYLETRLKLIRCKTCAAAWGEQPPAVIEADETSVPAGIAYQPSIGFGGGQ